MTTLEKAELALLNVTDEQWLELVSMLTYGVLELNARKLTKVETMYSVGHYPAMHFRLTTILDNPIDDDFSPQVSGFRFAFDQEMDDVYIETLSSANVWEDDLEKQGITHAFLSYEVGIKKLHAFAIDELKLWNEVNLTDEIKIEENAWKELTF